MCFAVDCVCMLVKVLAYGVETAKVLAQPINSSICEHLNLQLFLSNPFETPYPKLIYNTLPNGLFNIELHLYAMKMLSTSSQVSFFAVTS